VIPETSRVAYQEDQACYEVEIPSLSEVANGPLLVYIALNGQQFVTSEAVRINYNDTTEP